MYSNTSGEGGYYFNHLFDKDTDFKLEFTYVEGHMFAPLIRILTNNNLGYIHTLEYNFSDSTTSWTIYENNLQYKIYQVSKTLTDLGGSPPIANDIIKIIRQETLLKLYINNIEIASTTVNIYDDFYLGFGCHKANNRYTIFRDWKIDLL